MLIYKFSRQRYFSFKQTARVNFFIQFRRLLSTLKPKSMFSTLILEFSLFPFGSFDGYFPDYFTFSCCSKISVYSCAVERFAYFILP